MKTVTSLLRRWRRLAWPFSGYALVISAIGVFAQAPTWWTDRSVSTGTAASDYSPANQGQAKWMATQAYDEFVEKLPRGSNDTLNILITGFSQSGNYLPLNNGQLKALAKPFYDRIQEAMASAPYITNALPTGMGGLYPWTSATTDDRDFAPVNIGQLKYTFSFDFDRGGNGLPDWWEVKTFGHTGIDSNADPDNDGLSNLQEFRSGTDPNNPDTDHDGRTDLQEITEGTDPLDVNSVASQLLGYWRFNETNSWLGEQEQLPIAFTNITGLPSWSGTDVSIASSAPARLSYRVVETNGASNIALTNGTLRFWFKSAWSSTNAGGSGPGIVGTMIAIGHWTSNASYGYWGLQVDSTGTKLQFALQAAGVGTNVLQSSIQWRSNEWHQIAVVYSASSSALYLDGSLAAYGAGFSCYPNAQVCAEGFTIGSDYSGTGQAGGQYDELERVLPTYEKRSLDWNLGRRAGGQRASFRLLFLFLCH